LRGTVRDNAQKLENWFHHHARKLPWRERYDPYAIWISEVMLQQTQVATVIPYYHRFLERFPNIDSLARAKEWEVLSAWSGLGYYSRGKNLHRGAKVIAQKFGGVLPKEKELLLDVPGIGPYTAGAILSIAYDLRAPIVDGNVRRVFARFFGIRASLKTRRTQKFFWAEAEKWVTAASSPRHLNQALMELGATLCSKSSPRCIRCPLRENCVGFSLGLQNKIPRREKRKKMVQLEWLSLIHHSKGKIFLCKNKPGLWWAGLWDFPRIEPTARQKLRFSEIEELAIQKHTVTHHRIQVTPLLIEHRNQKVPSGAKGKWFAIDRVETLPVSSLVKKVIRSRLL